MKSTYRMIKINKKKLKRFFVFIGLLLVIGLIVLVMSISDSNNAGNIEKYSKHDNPPTIIAENGIISIDDVSMKVPQKNASYSIGYDWGEKDTEYPTVPSSATVNYTDIAGNVAYELYMYRNSIVPKNSDSNKTVETWFDSWKTSNNDDVKQEKYRGPHTEGIIIRSSDTTSNDENAYCSYSYYFVIETAENIEQYAFTLNCYDSAYFAIADQVFKSCINSIDLNKESKS